MKSIQTKILVLVISGLLVLTAAVSAVAVNMTHEIMHRDADRILNNVTQKEAALINDVLGDTEKSAAIMEHYATSEITSVSELKDGDFYNAYVEKNKKMFSEIVLNTKRITGFYMRLNPDYAGPTAGFYCLYDESGAVQSMPVTDLSKYDKNDERNVGWYYTPVNEGRGLWLDPYLFPGHDEPLITYAVPLYVGSELLGVIGFDMDFGYLAGRVDEISVYEHGYALLVSKDQTTVYNEAEEAEEENPHTHSAVELRNGMTLKLCADYKDIQKDARPMLSHIVFIFLGVMALSILYTIFVTRRIVRPLKALTLAASKLSSGLGLSDLAEIPTDSKDEVGTLAKVLTDTYKTVQDYTAYINALAYRDSLTGIKNSTAYTEAIAELNKEINRSNPKFGVVVVDINNLKETNDTFGHDIGNDLIVHTAKILTEVFKSSTVFRIGGDEFAVILKDQDFASYRDLISSLDEHCAKDSIAVCEKNIPLSVARGVSLFDPQIDRVYEDVFSKADHAMYLDKQEKKSAGK